MSETATTGTPPSQDTSLPLLRAHPLIGREENMKLLFDDVMSDISHDRKTSLRLSESAQLQQLRHQTNANTIDHLVNAAMVIAMQTGATTEQTASGPEHTAEGAEDTANAGVSVSAQTVATSLGNLASALVPIITASAGVVTAQSLAALLPIVVAAAGQSAGTSTASTTK
jgi:hypothetical protein